MSLIALDRGRVEMGYVREERVGPEETRRANAGRRVSFRDDDARHELTAREREVMDHIVRGVTNPEIALALHVSPKTVKNHVNRIFAKLGVTHRTAAVACWLGLDSEIPAKPGSG